MSERVFFVIMAFVLLLVTTNRFDGDLFAFAWSLSVLGGAMYFE